MRQHARSRSLLICALPLVMQRIARYCFRNSVGRTAPLRLRESTTWRILLAVVVCVSLITDPKCCAAEDQTTTWADSHPELLEIFGHPFMPQGIEHRDRFPTWPSVTHTANLPASQPSVVLANSGDLFANCGSWIARSNDGGRTWQNAGKPPRTGEIPSGSVLMLNSLDGCGVTHNGTILAHYALQHNDGRPYEGLSDPSYHIDLYVIRSTDGGQTWQQPFRLNAAPTENAGAHRTRFFHMPDGAIALAMGTWFQSSSGPLPEAERYVRSFIWRSSDDGKIWHRDRKPFCLYGAEPDLLVLPSGRILASVRYQRHKLPHDPKELASPHRMRNDSPPYADSKRVGVGLVARNTAVLHSDDGGKSWTDPRIVTGFDEQTGCLVRLSDGTVILVFGHKTDRRGQRFMLSYDEGETWSRTVYNLGIGGLYASSVVLSDGTIVTVSDRSADGGSYFQAIRWTPPSRDEVSKKGFWRPRVAEPLGKRVSANTSE